MKTIGLIGGMSWESSLVYYELLNTRVKSILGGHHSAKCIMISLDFAEIERLQHMDKWEELNSIMSNAAIRLEKAGADIILLCTNTMHLCSPSIISSTGIPFLHIAEATGEQIHKQNLKKVGLLGTRYTMEMEFYRSVLSVHFNIEVIIPDKQDRQIVHQIIYNELVHGEILDSSRNTYLDIIRKLELKGAEGIILGCTEIPLLVRPTDLDLPLFDTTKIHVEKAVDWALSEI